MKYTEFLHTIETEITARLENVCNLSEFICEVNSTEVRDEEVLGERYYIYDSKTDTVY